MLMREAKVMKAGRTFTGRFRVTGSGNAASVLVLYETTVICAQRGGLPEEVVAETLLGELVQEALAGKQHRRQH